MSLPAPCASHKLNKVKRNTKGGARNRTASETELGMPFLLAFSQEKIPTSGDPSSDSISIKRSQNSREYRWKLTFASQRNPRKGIKVGRPFLAGNKECHKTYKWPNKTF